MAVEHLRGRVLFIVLLLSIAGRRLPAVEGCIENERRALLAVKSDMYDPGGRFSSWTSDDCCRWRGVACDNATAGHVAKLDLRYPFPKDNIDAVTEGVSMVNPSLLELRHLKHLDLSMNDFNGARIPEMLASLAHLEYLNLSSAMFGGSIPPQLGNLSSLRYLDLSNCYCSMIPDGNRTCPQLRANIIGWLSRIPSLEYLDMSCVDLSGATSWLRHVNSIPSLQELYLGNARLPRVFSSSPFNLASISVLDLSGCQSLSTAVLVWLSNASSLERLFLQDCYLGLQMEPLQAALGSLPDLKTLNLSNCGVSGDISGIARNISRSLRNLDLSSNSLVGRIPPSLWRLWHLEYLDLLNNSLDGRIPETLGNLTSLRHLNLAFNDIVGEIPATVGNLARLEFLRLSYNRIVGKIPLAIGNLTSLVFLAMGSNNISGRIPETLGNLIHLEVLGLAVNNFSGEIPESLGSLKFLQRLELDRNYKISGRIPEFLSNLSSLKVLYLYDNNITGQLPETIGNIYNLEELWLYSNKINGRLPQSIGNLYNLQVMVLYLNSITGEIPWSMGNLTNLVHLDLSWNRITGGVPKSFCNLYNLQKLLLIDNSITGEMPWCMGNLTNLVYLDLSWNRITGGVPKSFGNLYNLQTLILDSNNLSGTVPLSLGHLSQLRNLGLSSNSLRGNITAAHFTELANLDILLISYNFLNVILPNDWRPPFNATTIIMNSCHMRGELPYWIQTQKGLKQLHLSGVGLSGDLPAWFSDFITEGALEELDLSSNNLSGRLPFNPKGILLMNLSNNSFIGPIPSSLISSSTIRILILSYNHIDGTIPSSFCNLTSLSILDLSKNHISREIPNCGYSFPISLQSLHLNDNDLSGPLPSFLTYCRDLVALDLSENNFYDEIPIGIGANLSALKVLQLRSNMLHGVIPVNLANLTSLQVLDLSFNRLHGSIPSLFGNFSSMIEIQSKTIFAEYEICHSYQYCSITTSGGGFYKESIVLTAKGSTNDYTKVLSLVTSMDLSNNNLSGVIPEELANLLGLHFLSLSNNHLIGSIPENIGSMKQLLSLDLSVNNLTGAIPSSLVDIGALEHLNLSYNNLSGRIPKGNQMQTFADPSLFVGNKDLCGFPLPECPSDDAVPSDADNEGAGEDKLNTILEYTFIVVGFVVGFWVSMGTLILKQSIRVSLFRSTDKLYDMIYVKLAMWLAKQAEAQE